MSFIIGHRSYSVNHNVLNYDCRNPDGAIPKIIVGKFCSIATNCTFILANHKMDCVSTAAINSSNLFPHGQGNVQGYSRGDIVIDNDVWIGAHVIIMDNVHIGSGAVVAAGSVVTKDVPPYTIVGGNPARFIKKRFTDEQIEKLLEIKWWDRPEVDTLEMDIKTSDIDGFIEKWAAK